MPRIPKTLPILMLSGDMDQVVPKKHMHALWEIAMKRGDNRNDKGGSSGPSPSDVSPSKDVFKSFAYGSHGRWLHQFIREVADVL